MVTSAVITPTVPGNTTFKTQAGAYVSDAWQITPGLTADLGLRYDWDRTPNSNWPTRVWSNRTNSLTPPGAPVFQTYYGNWAPRIGIAWTPRSNLVFRAGYGFFIEALPIGNFYNQVTNTLPGSATFSIANIPNLSYPITQFTSSGKAPAPSITGFDWYTRNPKSIQWTTIFGYQLSDSMVLHDPIMTFSTLLTALVLLGRARFRASALTYMGGMWVSATYSMAMSGGVRSPAQILYVTLPISATWLVGYEAALWASGICVSSALAFAVLEAARVHVPRSVRGTPLGAFSTFGVACLIGEVPIAQILRDRATGKIAPGRAGAA